MKTGEMWSIYPVFALSEQGRFYAQILWDKDISCNVISETNAEKLKIFLLAFPEGRV
jgi:hypothetical protein